MVIVQMFILSKTLPFIFLLMILLVGVSYHIITVYYSDIVVISAAYASSSSSPPFVRQEVKDSTRDGWDHSETEFTSSHNFTDIIAISYSSDGRFLNATFFLQTPFVESPSNSFTAYGMLIDADSDYNSGWQGYDYMARISWDSNTNSWYYLLQEWSSVSITRVLEEKPNIAGFFDTQDQNRYVHIFLDLDKISSPKAYRILFFTDYDFQQGNQYHEISDYSNVVHIPPPDFTISTTPNSVSLRPGEQKTVEVQINSSTPVFRPHVVLSTNNITNLESFFTPSERDIPPIGIATSLLNIKASENALPSPHTLQIFANLSFPTQYIGGQSPIRTIISENITENSNLAITILEPLSFAEKFRDFWSTYGDLVSLIGGGFAAGIAALVLDRLRKKHTVG